jgi:hypothetical protein
MAADLLARVRAEIDARMAELRPAIAEYEQLLGAAEALERDASAGGVPAEEAPARPARRSSTSRAEPSRRARAEPSRAGRAKPSSAGRAKPSSAGRAKSPRKAAAKSTPAQQAIVAALEHGSHTVGELVVVTAMPGADIRDSLRRLQRAGTITRSRREGRIAYVLSGRA